MRKFRRNAVRTLPEEHTAEFEARRLALLDSQSVENPTSAEHH
jgi:hypothetical protein